MDDTLDASSCALTAFGRSAHRNSATCPRHRRANVASALGTIWSTYGAPGSLFLTLFMKEGLHAQKWQIGLLMTVTFLGPIWEPAGAFLAERLGKRRPCSWSRILLSRMGFFFLAAIPLLASRGMAPQRGIVLVLLVVAITRFFNHLGNPSWWSWMADLVHERRRGRFFGCRTQASSAVAAGCVLFGLTAVEFSGGMSNGRLLSGLFFLGAVFGVTDICLYFRIPEPPLARKTGRAGFGSFLGLCHRANSQSRIPAIASRHGALVVQRQPRAAVLAALPARRNAGRPHTWPGGDLDFPGLHERDRQHRRRSEQPPLGALDRSPGARAHSAPWLGLSVRESRVPGDSAGLACVCACCRWHSSPAR